MMLKLYCYAKRILVKKIKQSKDPCLVVINK